MLKQAMEHKIKIKLKTTIGSLATIMKRIYIIYRTFCFILFMLFILIANQAALEKNRATI